MLLGDIIARLDDEAVADETLVRLGDLVLLGRVQEAAAVEGETAGEFAARAVRLFSVSASEEDWVSMIGVMGQTTEPGMACLRRMVEFALRPQVASPACGCGH
ncbi:MULTISPECIES: hypothetical protein [Methylobacterium]|uniref:Protein of unassigned function n=2 Tax=Methylobacterium TaxID=407 RepID=A0A089NY52_9HYPH|nr:MULTISPECIES: hypothetical protein [Methylobacterium]ACB24574.1 hypothetical protein Mrad2831_2587 [Methylobacterium radiotolerans JCM 2831]AIQ90753.1 protein of unassigned function [Methylobacterium oryzae CBMB20]GEN00906.1 hypothetical protein MRA01_54450 [Methylobacterium radiotolerans]